MSLVAQVPFALCLRELTCGFARGTGLLAVAGFSLCAIVFVGAAFTPPVDAKRRAFVL